MLVNHEVAFNNSIRHNMIDNEEYGTSDFYPQMDKTLSSYDITSSSLVRIVRLK